MAPSSNRLRTRPFQGRNVGFESRRGHHGSLAQLVEHLAVNQEFVSSSLTGTVHIF